MEKTCHRSGFLASFLPSLSFLCSSLLLCPTLNKRDATAHSRAQSVKPWSLLSVQESTEIRRELDCCISSHLPQSGASPSRKRLPRRHHGWSSGCWELPLWSTDRISTCFMLMRAASCVTLLHVRVLSEKEMRINTLWVLFHVEGAKIEIKQQADGNEPFVYIQPKQQLSCSFFEKYFPSLHTHTHTSLVLLYHGPQNKRQVCQNSN